MKKTPKQTTRTATESKKWMPHGGFSVGRGNGGIGGKVQGRSIIDRHKIDEER